MPPARSPSSWTSAQLVVFGAIYGSLLTFICISFLQERAIGLAGKSGQVAEFVKSSYVREVSDQEIRDLSLRGLLSGLDGYSHYYASGEELASLGRETSGHYLGLGVVFATPASEYRVLFALPGSPGDRAGLKTGDRILELDGEDLAKAEPGTLQRRVGERPARPVRLRVADLDQVSREIDVLPADLIDPTVRHTTMLDGEMGIGYLAINSFTKETPAEFDAALALLLQRSAPRWDAKAPLRGLVLDLRGNLGGVLSAAVAIANRFLPSGRIVSREGRGGSTTHEADPQLATLAGLPLVVLQDGDSASASEVLAGALQDHRVAVLVGEESYGKGVVQTIRQFQDSAVRLTTAYYYTPARRNLERTVEHAWETGLMPDLLVKLQTEERRAVRTFLQRYSPPPAALESIRAWEARENRPLLPQHPPDAQLEAALALLRGERPGAWIETP